MNRALIPGLLVVSAGFAPYLRNGAEFSDWAFEAARAVAIPLRVIIMRWPCRFRRVPFDVQLERGFHPVPEHPAIERRTQQYKFKEISSCDS